MTDWTIAGDKMLRTLQEARDDAIRDQQPRWVYIDLTHPQLVWSAAREGDVPLTAIIAMRLDWNFSPYQDQLLSELEQKNTVIDEVTSRLVEKAIDGGSTLEQAEALPLVTRLRQARAGTLSLVEEEDDSDDESHD